MIQGSRLKRKKGLKRSLIRRVSKKRAKELLVYSKLREKFLEDQPWCEIGAAGCTRKSQDVHHIRGRIGKRLNERHWFAACCRRCHSFLHDNPMWAREHNWIQA